MSAKNKKLLAVLGAAAVVVIVIAAVLLGKGGQTTTVDPASTPSDVSAEDVDSSNTPDSSSSEPLVVVPDASKPEATDSQMSKGHFTSSGHFMVLRGVTSEGKILVADPASKKRSEQEWDISIILDEARKGAAAGGPLWAIY